MSKKIIVLIVILVIILALGIGGYFGVKKVIQIVKEKGGEMLQEQIEKERKGEGILNKLSGGENEEQMGEGGIPGGLPNTSETGGEEAEGETSGSEENNPIFNKDIEDISQKEMIEYCQQQANGMVTGTPIYLKDSCFYQIAVHFRNPELCNNIDVADSKKKCLEAVEDFSEKWNEMQGKIGKMNESLYVKIGAEARCAMLNAASAEAYQKWLEEWPKNLNNKFGVTMEEYKLYSEVISQDELSAMDLGTRVIDRADEICPD